MLAEFGDVGLMTGDVTINPSASCLVMTTEVRALPLLFVLHPFTMVFPTDSAVNALPRLRNRTRSRLGHL